MNKENFSDDESYNEDDDKNISALLDSDIDEIEAQLDDINSKYESEEYRW